MAIEIVDLPIENAGSFQFIYADVILPIDFHSIIFQDAYIKPPTSLFLTND